MNANVIGIDIGGTKILAGRFETDNLFIPKETLRIPTEAKQGREKVLENLLITIDKLKNENTKSIGLSWAGFVDTKNGIINKSSNIIEFEGFLICDFLFKKVGLPVFLENDARLFALAEQQFLFKKPKTFLGIILGTGIGSGIIISGKVLTGNENFAGEIGHQLIFEKETNTTVQVEDLFAGPGLEKLLGDKLKNVEDKMKTDLIFKKEVQQKMEPRIELLSEWIHNLIYAFNPEKIVFGGGVGQHFWPLFFEEINQKITKKIEKQGLPITFSIEKAQLENAGLVGAAILAEEMWSTSEGRSDK